ncbi:hypothetical protein HN51_033966 [Arachis hypogaea]
MAMKSVIITLLIIGVVMCFVFAESHEIILKESSTPSYYTIQNPRDVDSIIPNLRKCIKDCINSGGGKGWLMQCVDHICLDKVVRVDEI